MDVGSGCFVLDAINYLWASTEANKTEPVIIQNNGRALSELTISETTS
jgi:hypothetical protein